MELKTVQWNIGGGKVCRKGADPSLLASYTVDGLDEIIDFLRRQDPDIVTLQETHVRDKYCQAQIMADALNFEGWVNDEWADSHIEAGMRLGQGIMSRLPMRGHSFGWFTNPNWQVEWEDGSMARSHDKGRTRSRVDIGKGYSIVAQTLRTIPFRRFKVATESQEARHVLDDMTAKLMSSEVGILQADFNIDSKSLKTILPDLFEAGFKETTLSDPTEVRGHYYDHVLYRGLRLVKSIVVKSGVLTDHYPIVTTFELNDSQ